MRRVRGNSRGLSEIVGTLILILIVVAAATALSVFVTGYEKTVLSQEAVTHQKDLESYKIFGIGVPENTTPSLLPHGYVVFNLASTSVEASSVASITIDDQPVWWYCALPPGADPVSDSNCTGAAPRGLGGQWISLGEALPFSPLEDYRIVVNYNDTIGFDDNGNDTNAFNKPIQPAPVLSDFPLDLTGTFVVSIFSSFDNTFSQIMLAPVAIATVTTLNVPGSPAVVTVLDGQVSIQPGGNDSIVAWQWQVTNLTNQESPVVYESGEEIPLADLADGGWVTLGNTYSIQLTVLDATGLYSNDTIDWTAEF